MQGEWRSEILVILHGCIVGSFTPAEDDPHIVLSATDLRST